MPGDPASVFWLTVVATLAAGWAVTVAYNAHRSRRARRRRERRFEGLRYLLDDKPDRALEVFLSLAPDDETVETHFALGSLYRRRGEVDRAIRVHQHIVDRTSLDARHRDAALTELGKDFFRAGLLDRAEELFLQLAEDGSEPAVALDYLLRIYELQRDWPRAIAINERLRTFGLPERSSAVAHYHCELATAALAASDFDAARSGLRKARDIQPGFSRSAILRGDLARQQGEPELALKLYRSVVRRDFHLLPLVLPRLAEAAAQSSDPAALEAAIAELIQLGAERAEIGYAAVVSGYFNDPLILECVREMVATDNDLRDLTGALLEPGAEPSAAQLLATAEALRNVVLRHARYRCSECGMDSSSFLWHCPRCKSWGRYRAIAALEILPRAARPGSNAD
jgi:lipopolysaccharide biosynthesis regulator YciM